MPVRKKRAKEASETILDPKTDEAPEIAGKTAEVPETGENTAAGFPVVCIGALAGGLAAFEGFYYRHYYKVLPCPGGRGSFQPLQR